MDMKGKLIVIEGLDGSGKATQSQFLCDRLLSFEVNVKHISFPDYSQPSSSLVKMYLNGDLGDSPDSVNAYAASSFYAVDRYASYIKFWKQLYDDGNIIIADRYTTSNMVYQMCKLQKNEWDDYISWLEDYEYNKLQLPRPDAVIYLDMPIKISQDLMNMRYDGDNNKKDLHEKNINYLFKCQDTAYYALEKLGWGHIHCSYNNKPRGLYEIRDDVYNCLLEAIFSD